MIGDGRLGDSRPGGGEVEILCEGRNRGEGRRGTEGVQGLSVPLADTPTLCWSVLSTRITRSWLARPPAAFEPVLKTCVMQLSTCSMEPEMMYMSCEGGG